MESICVESGVKESEKGAEEDKEKEGEEKREGARSRSSSTSSEDYIIILPDCFDTSRPLGESMYRYVPSELHMFSWECVVPVKFMIIFMKHIWLKFI